MAISATVRAEVGVAHSNSNLPLAPTATISPAISFLQSFTDGAGANQVDRVYAARLTLVASATQDLDLNAGALTDAYGATVSFNRIKAIAVSAAAGNTNNVVIGGAAATQFVGFFGAGTHTVSVKPGGFFCIVTPDATGWTIAAGSSDFLRVGNSGGSTSVTFDIVILGSST